MKIFRKFYPKICGLWVQYAMIWIWIFFFFFGGGGDNPVPLIHKKTLKFYYFCDPSSGPVGKKSSYRRVIFRKFVHNHTLKDR